MKKNVKSNKAAFAGVLFVSTVLTSAFLTVPTFASLGTWKKEGMDWKYYNKDGKYLTSWVKDNNKWYYLDPANGKLKTGWQYIDGKWYFLNPTKDGNEGAMLTGWNWIDGNCYFLEENGALTVNGKTKDGYMVDKDGKWLENNKVVTIAGKGFVTKTSAGNTKSFIQAPKSIASNVFANAFIDENVPYIAITNQDQTSENLPQAPQANAPQAQPEAPQAQPSVPQPQPPAQQPPSADAGQGGNQGMENGSGQEAPQAQPSVPQPQPPAQQPPSADAGQGGNQGMENGSGQETPQVQPQPSTPAPQPPVPPAPQPPAPNPETQAEDKVEALKKEYEDLINLKPGTKVTPEISQRIDNFLKDLHTKLNEKEKEKLTEIAERLSNMKHGVGQDQDESSPSDAQAGKTEDAGSSSSGSQDGGSTSVPAPSMPEPSSPQGPEAGSQDGETAPESGAGAGNGAGTSTEAPGGETAPQAGGSESHTQPPATTVPGPQDGETAPQAGGSGSQNQPPSTSVPGTTVPEAEAGQATPGGQAAPSPAPQPSVPVEQRTAKLDKDTYKTSENPVLTFTGVKLQENAEITMSVYKSSDDSNGKDLKKEDGDYEVKASDNQVVLKTPKLLEKLYGSDKYKGGKLLDDVEVVLSIGFVKQNGQNTAINGALIKFKYEKDEIAEPEITQPPSSDANTDENAELSSSQYEALDRTQWKAKLTDKSGAIKGENETKKLFDDDTSTFIDFQGQQPFTLEIDLGSKQTVHGFSVDKRPAFNNEQQKNPAPEQWGLNGMMLGYEIKISENGTDWNTLETGAFTKEDYKLHHQDNLYNIGKTVYKKFAKSVTTQYIQIIQTSNFDIYNDQDFTSSEIKLYTKKAESTSESTVSATSPAGTETDATSARP